MTDADLNDFAIRCFRDMADGDYIAARMACRAVLIPQFLWASQQAVEKYLKCILLLNRIRARHVGHDLSKALKEVNSSGKLKLDLTERSRQFIDYLDTYGRFRYLEVSYWSEGRKIMDLDQTVWELRRFCALAVTARQQKLVEGRTIPRVRLSHGHLERIQESKKRPHPARAALLWQNGFFGRSRRTVRIGTWMQSTNAPLAMEPGLFRAVDEYVYLPREVRNYWLAVEAGKRPDINDGGHNGA